MSENNYKDFESGLYSDDSSEKVKIRCDYGISERCENTCIREYNNVLSTLQSNEGKFVCLYCLKFLEQSGRLNPNTKTYLDHRLLSEIDTEGKAYLLGCIISSSVIKAESVRLEFPREKLDILLNLRDIICNDLPVVICEDIVYMNIMSSSISKDVCRYISFDKTTMEQEFPELENDILKWSFIRGYFDASNLNTIKQTELTINSGSKFILSFIREFCNISCSCRESSLIFSGTNCLDFLFKMYGESNPHFRCNKNYGLFVDIVTRPENNDVPHCLFYKTDKNAVIPFKHRASDIGYDLTIIREVKRYNSRTIMYDTGIIVSPKYGYYTKIVPRSSIIKSGYMLSNSVGIIDPTFLGSLKVVLTKIDDDAPDLQLPFTCSQLILERAYPFQMKQVFNEDDLQETKRGEGGFGSTG